MTIRDILAKLAKGEALTDAEKAFLEKFDPDQGANDAAAAARRKAEAKQAELQAEVDRLTKLADEAGNAGKSEVDKAQQQIRALSEQIATMNKRLEDADKKVKADARNGRIAAIMKDAGIQFVPGLDHDLLQSGFARAFEAIGDEDLGNKTVIDPIVTRFKDLNKAAIAVGGHGAGTPPHTSTVVTPGMKNPWKEDAFNLTKQAQLLKENPVEAQRLATEAGVKLELNDE